MGHGIVQLHTTNIVAGKGRPTAGQIKASVVKHDAVEGDSFGSDVNIVQLQTVEWNEIVGIGVKD